MKALRNSLFAAAGLVILVGALVPSLSDARGFGFAFGFANRVAGSYLAVAELQGLPVPVQLLITINRDGTLQVSNSNDFGSGASLGFSTLSHGAWKKTGFLEISGTIFALLFDNTGLLVAISQTNFRQRCIDKHCDMIDAELSVAFFACNAVCPNPQNVHEPPLVPFIQTSGTYSGERIIPAGVDANNSD